MTACQLRSDQCVEAKILTIGLAELGPELGNEGGAVHVSQCILSVLAAHLGVLCVNAVAVEVD